jgi:hypothetical protein
MQSKYILAMGLPKLALLNMNGELFLGDIGIPKVVYHRVLKANHVQPFGDKFIVGLNRSKVIES